MRQRNFAEAVRLAVREGRLKEPFGGPDVEVACPGYASTTYATFLAKHCEGNPDSRREFFRRVSRGRYVLLDR